MDYPLVTIFTLIYNTNSKYIIEAIESIRANNYPNIQHIIIDDCSQDSSPKKIVKNWILDNNYDCEFYEHDVNLGICKTLNIVLELSKGKYIFGCSDDVILEDKIITEVSILENLDDNYVATYSDAYLIDENSNLMEGLFIDKYRCLEVKPDIHIFDYLLDGNFLCAVSMIWRLEALKKVGGYDEELRFEDYDMHLRLFKLNKIKFIDRPLAKYRIHPDSISSIIKDWSYDYFKIYKKHLDSKKISLKLLNIKNDVILKTKSVDQLIKFEIKYPYIVFFLIKIGIPRKTIIFLFSFIRNLLYKLKDNIKNRYNNSSFNS